MLKLFLIACVVSVQLHASLAYPPLRAAARTFAITPEVGVPASHSQIPEKIVAVHGDLKTTIILLEQGDNRLVFLTSSLGVEKDVLRLPCVAEIAKILQIAPEAVVANSSHNHTIPWLEVDAPGESTTTPPKNAAHMLGRDFIAKLRAAASELTTALEPVAIEWGVAEENRVTYNRRGRRADGKTYFMREEDRLRVGEGYIGLIDPEASVVVLRGARENVVGAFAFFTGHPVTAYTPEKQISFGQWSQVACDKLSAHLGGAPVAFLQGCGGDVNSKYMLTGTVEQAIELGNFLGDSYIIAANSLRASKRNGLEWNRQKVDIPLAPIPDTASLERDLASIDDFVRRGNAGDQNTFECVGMNFPVALSPPYRARLVQLVRPWYVWALDQRRNNTAKDLPAALPLEIVIARFGDVGFVGLPFEAFVRTGLKIKHEANLPHVLTCGYTDGSYGYIPDATACDDREYQAGYFRYRGNVPPFRAPGGDAAAEAAIIVLNRFAK